MKTSGFYFYRFVVFARNISTKKDYIVKRHCLVTERRISLRGNLVAIKFSRALKSCFVNVEDLAAFS